MLPMGTISKAHTDFSRSESHREQTAVVRYETRYSRCRGLDDFFQPSPSAKPPHLVYPRGTEWWDGDEHFSPFYPPVDHPTRRLDISHLRILRCKSDSASCRVTLARHIDTGGVVCMKIFDRARSASISRAMNEVRAYKRIVAHPGSLSLVEAQAVFRDSDSLYIVMVGLILQSSRGRGLTRHLRFSPHFTMILPHMSGGCHHPLNSQRLSCRR
jgi:hypothetical protein